MSTNQSSSRRVNQSDIVQLDSPTLLSKLDQLESQMKLAFPLPTKKSSDDNLSKSIKSPSTLNKSSAMKSEQLKSPTLTQSTNLNENKENINEKSIKIDKQAKSSKTELISPMDVQKIQLSTPSKDIIKKPNESTIVDEINQQSPSISKIATSVNISPTSSNTITVSATNTTTTSALTNTSNKPLSAWKRTKILSKTLSSINVMKSRAGASPTVQTVQTVNNQHNLKIKDDSENQLKKSSSGNLVIDHHHHLNSPLNQIKRRSQEEVSSGLNVNTPRLSSSLSSSCQTSIHNLNESTKVNSQAAIQAALNQSTGTHNIPDNYNTTIINQLNKNYLKNIQKQKARSDWKSLKNKLIGLARKESDEDATVEQQNNKATDYQESTANTSQRKLSNSNQADDGIICKKEDLFFLLRNSNLAKNRQRRSNKPSLADVVVQLQESKVKKANTAGQDKAQSSNDNPAKKVVSENNQSIQVHENNSSKLVNNFSKNKQATSSNGRVQFVLSNNEQNANASSSSTPTSKIKSSLKKTSSTASTNLVDKNQNSLTRQTKSNTINNMNLNKKKVKIYETDQDGIRKALILQSVKDRNNNEKSNEEDELNDKNKSKNKEEDEENKEDENDYKVKWDNENIVDAGALGDAIAAFLSSITTNPPTANQSSEKKVSFKK